MTPRAEPIFSSQDALRFGWSTTCANLKPLIVFGLAGAFLGLLNQALGRVADPPGLAPLLRLALELIQAALFMSYLRVSLQLADGRAPDFSRPHLLLVDFFAYLLTTLLYSLIVLGGLLLLVIPGVMWAVRFGYAPLLVLDGKTDPVEALRESARVTQGARTQLFAFASLLLAINLLGALAFGVGLLVTVPTGMIAAAHVMRLLQARASSFTSRPTDRGELSTGNLSA